MRETIRIDTDRRETLMDITAQVEAAVQRSRVRDGLVSVYVQHATAAVMIQENTDATVPNDVVTFLHKLIPAGGWEHDAHDDNADAHLKAGIVGPGETLPIVEGRLGLGRWQGIFLCEFDGPRRGRTVVCTVLPVPE